MTRASENTFSNDLSPDAEWSIAAHAAPLGYLKKCRLLFNATKQFKSSLHIQNKP